MSYVNFTDALGNNFIDALDYQFMVRGVNFSKRGFIHSDDLKTALLSPAVSYTFHFYNLHEDESIREDLSQYLLEGGELSIQYQDGIRRKLSLSLSNSKNWIPHPFKGFLWKGSKFKLEIGVNIASVEYIYPAGVFVLQNFNISEGIRNGKIDMELVDKFGNLDGSVGGKIIEPVDITVGSNIRDLIFSLLRGEKIHGYYIDNKKPIFPSSLIHSLTPFSIFENSESTVGALISKLATIVNLNVFYDENGRMCFEEMQENMLYNSASSIWSFDSSFPRFKIASANIDFQKVENIVVVEGANINGSVCRATSENTNPKSPTNTSMFEPNPYKVTDENIADYNSAKVRADYELFKRSLIPVSISIDSVLIPSLDVNTVINITDKKWGFMNERFLINSISIPISRTPNMNIQAANLEEVAFSEL